MSKSVVFGILFAMGFMVICDMREKLLGRLKIIRERAGLTARALSLRIFRAEGYIGKIENGSHFPPIEDLQKILEVCNSSFLELFWDDLDSYEDDKKILELLRKMNSKNKDPLISLLAAIYNLEEVVK